MYGQKFTPYSQFGAKNSQIFEQEYEQQQSEALVQEVDDTYEPTERQVREYAVQTLGMSLPQDDSLLYLAREGLKAPLPPNWVPYQSRSGQVYYKHRITQEKTLDHPTDVQYRKKYEQQKEKMARKNLKSMNMKGSGGMGVGVGGGVNSNLYNANVSNMFGSKLSNSGLLAGSGSGGSELVAKLDPRVEEELEEELSRYEERLRKEWREFEREEEEKCEMRLKKAKAEYEADLDGLFRRDGGESRMEDKLRAEKEKLKDKVQSLLHENVESELREFQKGQEGKVAQFAEVYREDNALKQSKYEQERQAEFSERQLRVREKEERAGQLRERKRREREEMLVKLKAQLQDANNQEIEQATQEALQTELAGIRQSYAVKVREVQGELQREYAQTRRVLGFDQSSYLSELAAKKARIKAASVQKLQSHKKKEVQVMNTQFAGQLQSAQVRLRERLQGENMARLQAQRVRQMERVAREKQRIDEETERRIAGDVDSIYSELKVKAKEYETGRNRQLSTMNERFIKEICDKSGGVSRQLTGRLEVREREMAIENKSQMITSLRRQIELERVTYDLMKLQKEIGQCSDAATVEVRLGQLAKSYGLQYRSEEYLRHQQRYNELKSKYKKDKEFLGSVMSSLQGPQKVSGTGGVQVLRQYNQDVRTMRDNEEMLRKVEGLLRRAEGGDRQALEELGKGEGQYKEIEMRREMGRLSYGNSHALNELAEENVAPVGQGSGRQDLEHALRDHSKFLTTMRHELNRKLYHLRSTHY